MSLQSALFQLSVLLIGIAGQQGTITWVPSMDMDDHDINPGMVVGGFAGATFGLFTKGLDDNNVAERVKLYFYSRENPYRPLVLKVGQSFDLVTKNIKKPFKFILHGYMHSSQNTMPTAIRKELIDFHDVNVIEVDWSSISRHPWYFEVAKRTEVIGKYVARLLDSLASEGADPRDMHLIGHSLGAHASGFAANHFRGGKIGRISGLDPALPAFKDVHPSQRLDPEDATFVDCIHTCGGNLGYMKPICHVDFYPNGGRNFQPGCLMTDIIGMCSHLRAPKYFQESINPRHKFPVAKCPQVPNKDPVECTFSDVYMGYYLIPNVRGIYYGVTNVKYPYSVLLS